MSIGKWSRPLTQVAATGHPRADCLATRRRANNRKSDNIRVNGIRVKTCCWLTRWTKNSRTYMSARSPNRKLSAIHWIVIQNWAIISLVMTCYQFGTKPLSVMARFLLIKNCRISRKYIVIPIADYLKIKVVFNKKMLSNQPVVCNITITL